MAVTAEDYDRTFERFTADLNSLGDIVTSVLRFGSIARGELSPGKSDLMDAYVFLSEEMFASEAVFSQTIEAFVTTCRWLAETGLPYYHPFQYYCVDEVEQMPAVFAGEMKAKDTSDVFYGDDIRPRLRSSGGGRDVSKSGFIYLARPVFDLEGFRQMAELDEDQRRQVVGQLGFAGKFVPMFAALALGQELGGNAALRYLADLYPEADFGIFAEVKALREGALPSSDEVQNLLGRFISLIEMLHNDVVAELSRSFE